MRVTDLANTIASNCTDAYSAGCYRPGHWAKLAQYLLDFGATPREAEEVMRSKHTRWCRDGWPYNCPSGYPAEAILPHVREAIKDARDWHRTGQGVVPVDAYVPAEATP